MSGCGGGNRTAGPPASAGGGSVGVAGGGGRPGSGGVAGETGGAGGEGGDQVPPDAGLGGAGGTSTDAGPVKDTAAPPPDQAPPDLPTGPAVPVDIDGKLVINEIMASNGITLKNEGGLAADWIEIFNPTNQDVPLAGYSLTTTDLLMVTHKAIIGAGVVVPAGKYLLLWLDSVIDHGPTHLPLKLESEGGSLGLARPDGSFISRLVYGAQETDFSASREPDGSDAWVIEWHPSPGAANPGGNGHALAPATPATPPEQVPAAGDLTEKLLGYDAFPSLRIDVDADGIAKLLAAPTVYVPATLVYLGRSYGPVGLRLKGHNSFEPIDKKPSLKVSVDKYVADARFFGLKDITFNNMHSDATMMHERLAYWVARAAGVPASRASHALLSLNGKPPALYAIIETVKHKMMSRLFKNPEGALYEGTNVDFTTADKDFMPPRDDIPFFGLESKIDDRSLLYGLANALAMPSPNQAIAAASNYINLDEFQSFWAVCSVIGQFDSMPYSIPGDDFFVYGNPDDKKLYVLPWGMDETFEAADVDPIKRSYSVMAKTCAASPACLQGYVNKTWALLEKLEAMQWTLERLRIIDQIKAYTVMDRSKVYSDSDVLKAQDDMGFFVNERRQSLAKFLPAKTN